MDRSDGYTGTTLSATVRQVWLAGLGALSQAGKGGEDLLRDLVHRGEEIEALGKGTAQASSPQHPSGADNALVEEGRLILACAQLIDSVAQQRRNTERLIQAMLPEDPLPTPPSVLQARRNASAREA